MAGSLHPAISLNTGFSALRYLGLKYPAPNAIIPALKKLRGYAVKLYNTLEPLVKPC